MVDSVLGPAIPQLPSGDIEKTAAFFVGCLGFTVAAKYKEQKFLSLKRGATEIHFWQTNTEEEANKLGSNSSCYIRVQNIQSLYKEFKQNGATFRYELTKQPWGMNEMQIDDPYLNAIRFGESVD
jgi:uncharacterized glyoxalase superfamily protein PhnB